jgi:hypothetical protein
MQRSAIAVADMIKGIMMYSLSLCCPTGRDYLEQCPGQKVMLCVPQGAQDVLPTGIKAEAPRGAIMEALSTQVQAITLKQWWVGGSAWGLPGRLSETAAR